MFKYVIISIFVLFQLNLYGSADIEKSIVYADKILKTQYPDGGINMKISHNIYLVPYFSHFAAEGLIALYSVTKNRSYLDAVEDWLEWYVKHLNKDYTVYDYNGYYPHYVSTYYYDSTDSYAAGFLFLLWYYYDTTKDISILNKFYPSAKKVLKAIELTLNADGLTFCKPNLTVKYLMDNIEVYQGLDALWRIARIMKDKEKEDYVYKLKKRNLEGIKRYWYDTGFFGNAIIAEGNKTKDYDTVYPGGLVNIMFYDLMLDKNDPKAKEFVERLFKKFIYTDNLYKIDSTMMFWWTIAAYKKGDIKLGDKLKNYIEENLPMYDYVYSYGHYVRALLYKHSEVAKRPFNLINLKLDDTIMPEGKIKGEKVKFENSVAIIDDFKIKKDYITSGWQGNLKYRFVDIKGKKALRVDYSLHGLNTYAQLMLLYLDVADWGDAKLLEFEVKGFKDCSEELMVTIIENDGDWWTYIPDNKILKTGKWETFSYPIKGFTRDIWSVGGDEKFDIKNIKGIRFQINQKESTGMEKKGSIYLANVSITTRITEKYQPRREEKSTIESIKTTYEYIIDDFKDNYKYSTYAYMGEIKFKKVNDIMILDCDTKTFGGYAIFESYRDKNLNIDDINGKIILEVKVSNKLLDTIQFSLIDDDGDMWDYFIEDILNPDKWHRIEIPILRLGRNPWGFGNGEKDLSNIQGYRIQISHNRWNRGNNRNKIYLKPIKFIATKELDINKPIKSAKPVASKNYSFLIDNFDTDKGWDIFSYDAAYDFAITEDEKIEGLNGSLIVNYKLDTKDGYIELTKRLNRYLKIYEMKQFYDFESSQNICIWTKGRRDCNERLGIQIIDFDGDIWSFILEDAFKNSEWVLRKIPLIRFSRNPYSAGNQLLDGDKIKEIKLQIIYGGKSSGEHRNKIYLSQFYLE